MRSCPQCQGDHTLSQCPRWKVEQPRHFIPCSPDCGCYEECGPTRNYAELCSVVLPAPHEPETPA